MTRPSTGATVMRHASARATTQMPGELTLVQHVARYALTVVAMVALSVLFATQIAATLR